MINLLEWAGIILIGIIAGAGVNYLANVLPRTRRLSAPICPQCGQVLSWKAYLSFKKCPHCQHTPTWRGWLIQAIYPAAICLLYAFPNQDMGFWVSSALIIYFGLVAIIDIEHRLVLEQLSVVGGIGSAALGWYLHGILPTILGGLAGFLIMFAFYGLGFLYLKIASRLRHMEVDEIALGFGDVTLSLILGLLLGWPGIIAGIFFGILIGGLISGAVILLMFIRKKYDRTASLPYAPFLIAGALILLLG